MCASVSVGRTSVVSRFMVLSLLQSSHPGLARALIICSHFPHGNEPVITCLARLLFASCTALELIHDPRNSRLSPSLSRNSAAQVGSRFSLVVHFLKLEHTTPPPTRTVHQVTLSSCARRLPDSAQSSVGGAHEAFPVVPGLIQCFLPVKFSSPSNHCISDCFRPCCHMLHCIVVLPLICHSLGACRPLSTFRW